MKDDAGGIRHRPVRPVLLVACLAALACGGPQPPDPEMMARAREMMAISRFDAADRVLEEVLEKHPDHVESLALRGEIYSVQGRLISAAEVYSQLSRLQPDNGDYALKAGVYLEVLGRHHQAAPFLIQAVEQQPENVDALYRLGLHHFKAGRLQTAESLLRRALEVAPARTDVAITLAQALQLETRFQEALEILDPAITRDPGDLHLIFQRGLTRQRLGDAEGAIADLRQAAPGVERARYVLAQALLSTGREEEGRLQMERHAREEEQRRARQAEELQVLQWEDENHAKNPAAWRRTLEDMIQAEPSNPYLHRRLGKAFELEGDFQQAASSYGRVVRFDPGDAESRREWGRMLMKVGRAGDAVQVLEDAARMAPDDPEIGPLLRQARTLAAGTSATETQ